MACLVMVEVQVKDQVSNIVGQLVGITIVKTEVAGTDSVEQVEKDMVMMLDW